MAVVGSAQEMPNSPEGDFELGKYVVRRHFRVVCNSKDDGPLVVTAATGIPRLFDVYSTPGESSAEMRARRFSAARINPGIPVWVVTVTYETADQKESSTSSAPERSSGGGTGKETEGQFDNPTLELPTVKFHSTSREDLLTQIYDTGTGTLKPVTASTGQPYDPPPKYLQRALTLEISRNEDISTPHPALAMVYQNAVNADPFWGLAPGTWMCKDISAERQQRQLKNGTTAVFLRVTYQFEARADWDIVILDSGDYYYAPPPGSASNVYLPFLAPANLVAPPVPADNAGAAVTPARFRQQTFETAEGHPTSGALNGYGGALPPACTFTEDIAANTITVPAPTRAAPGQFLNGMAVQLWNTGGRLPPPLSPMLTYYVVNVSGDGLTFQLAETNYTSGLVKRAEWVNGSNLVDLTPSATETINGRTGVEVGMYVWGQGIAVGTTVTSLDATNPSRVLISANATSSTVVNHPGTLVFYRGAGAPIDLTADGSGVNTIKPMGVFSRIRPYQRLPFAALSLPQSWLDVQ